MVMLSFMQSFTCSASLFMERMQKTHLSKSSIQSCFPSSCFLTSGPCRCSLSSCSSSSFLFQGSQCCLQVHEGVSSRTSRARIRKSANFGHFLNRYAVGLGRRLLWCSLFSSRRCLDYKRAVELLTFWAAMRFACRKAVCCACCASFRCAASLSALRCSS